MPRSIRIVLGFAAALWWISTAAALAQEKTPPRPNVLFIAVDDLNHWVGYLGRNKQTKTPHIDNLAARGTAFTRSYCAAPVCNPSRAALMSGLRPSTSSVYDNGIRFEPRIPTEITLTTQFRKAGYKVYGAGKIYHNNVHRAAEWDDYVTPTGGAKIKVAGEPIMAGKFDITPLTCDDAAMPDYQAVSYAIEKLGEKHEQPFFLAVGLHKPHLPWNVPQKYYDLHPLDQIELPPHQKDDLSDVPAAGVKMAKASGDHEAITNSDSWKQAIQAYLASTSFCDAQIGRLLGAFDKSPHKENTIIVFWGDHGWHLGEKEHWRKFALWEEATRMPLIWVVPGVTKPGTVSERTVDLMSLYPTLCELASIPTPKHVEGVSIQKLLANPNAEWATPALTTHGFQNHAVRSERWRYIRYADGSEELYDHTSDPYEWKNVASDPAHAEVKKQLAASLPKQNVPEPAADRTMNNGPNKKKKKGQ